MPLALALTALVCTVFATVMVMLRIYKSFDSGVVIMEHVRVGMVRDSEVILWETYRKQHGGVSDRFMSMCDAVAEAEGDLELALVLHQERYPGDNSLWGLHETGDKGGGEGDTV